MLLYNITIILEETAANEWLTWMQGVQIPMLMDTGKFVSNRLLKVVDSPMKEMMDARENLDAMMNDIMQIIYLTMNGNDPLTAEPSPETLQEMQNNFMNM